EQQSIESPINTFFDGIWFTLVTIATVGYGDMYPHTLGGKLVSLIFVVGSFTIFGFLIGRITSFMTERIEDQKLGFHGTKFKGHAIIIGWNNAGQEALEQLMGVGKRVAIVTNKRDDIDLIRENYPPNMVFTLLSDFNKLESLEKANIREASIIYSNLDDDTANLVNLLNLRKFYGDLRCVVTLENSNLKETFQTAGVTYTVSKHEIASRLLASYIFEPDVARFAEDIMSFAESDDDYDIKEFRVTKKNPYAGKTYGEAFYDFKKKSNALLVGISKVANDERKLYKNPPDDFPVEADDFLIFILNGAAAKDIEEIFKVEEGIL
ncbi:MAG: NAD-binding protein, partial [Flavobacteriales bacterium]|nr:NAD-binding protein [Flavobacteriales bacterium]